jgi:hypothetical protein
MLRTLIPRPAKHALRAAHRTVTFSRAMRRLVRDPLAVANSDRDLAALVYGWGNEGFSAEYEYLRHMIRTSWAIDTGDIIECGSGLSTLALAAVAKHRNTHVVALEHIATWGDRVSAALARAGLADFATVRVTPLVSYGDYEWYGDPPRGGRFALVICDGPPSTTRGGRYGLWPQMHAQLIPGATILLDDLKRPDEQAILRQWTTESGGVSSVLGRDKPFGELRLH